jgi:Tol biopolymer transport system component
MKSRITVDTLAIGLILFLAAIAGFIIWIGESAGVSVRVDLPEDGLVGPHQAITFKFSEVVSAEMASELIALDPIHEGYLQTVDDTSVRFVPLKPFDPDVTYTVKVIAGETNIKGREVKKPQSWTFSIRETQVAYLVTAEGQSGIWSADMNGGGVKRLTSEEIKVVSFDVAQGGDFIIFTSVNQNGGIDLWKVSRDGGDQALLLDCGFDRCTTPVIAPGDTRIAYSREAAGPTPDLPFGSPRIWVVDLESGADGPVYEDQSILGYNHSWSPDGNRLASFDGLADFIHMIDFTSGELVLFPSTTGGPVAWSPDSTRLLYTTFEQTDNGGRTLVMLADLSTGETIPLFGSVDVYDNAYYSLAWSALEERLVLGLRMDEDSPSRVLWVLDPSLLEGIVIAQDADYTYNSPQWDPWGAALLFQQFKMRGQFKPEIGLWREGTNQATVLAEGILPQWLP